VTVLAIGVVTFYVTGRGLAESSPDFYSFLLGALILLQLTVHIRHVRNYILFRAMSTTDEIRGHLVYARPLMLKSSSIEIAMFAVMFAVLFILTGSPFVLGGAFGCTVVAVQHWNLMHRARRVPGAVTS